MITGDQISSVILRATDLARTLGFYKQELEMTESDGGLFFSDDQCKVKFVGVPDGEKFDRGQAFGRTAYACPANQLEKIQEAVKQSKFGASIQTELVTLPTPGKADVQVVIVADPVRRITFSSKDIEACLMYIIRSCYHTSFVRL